MYLQLFSHFPPTFFLQIQGSPGPLVVSLQRSNGPTDPKLAPIEMSFVAIVGWEIKLGWPKSKGEKRATYMTGKEGEEGPQKRPQNVDSNGAKKR